MTENREAELHESFADIEERMVPNRERAQRRWVTVEPVIALAVVGSNSMGLVRPFYLKSRFGELMYNMSILDDFSGCDINDTEYKAREDDIQLQASLWLLYLSMAGSVPMLIASILLGTLSDKLGRKMCIAVPLVGYIIQEAVYIATIYGELPLPVLFVGEVLLGSTGRSGLLFAGCISYIVDITTETQRTLRIALAEMTFLLLSGLAQVGVGYLVRDFSTLPPLLIAFGCNILCLIYIAVPGILIETVDRDNIPDHRKGLREACRSMVKLLKFNENGRRWQMLLLDFFLFVIIININGTISIFIIYGSAAPFCWDALSAGLAGAFGFLTASAGMVAGSKLFAICLGEYWIMQISCLSLLAFNIVMSVSQTTWLIYAANLMGAFRATAMPVARSILSKIVDPTEIGTAFALVACIDGLAVFVASAVAPTIYAASVLYLPPLIFYVFSGLTLLPVGTIIILQIFWPPSITEVRVPIVLRRRAGEEPEESTDVPSTASI
ncbi:proton-coupled folate transporter-like [Acanthaster planci]|uniref:Proton-coupled folate transporter n=1 Tax=Acanthaster planci TaxID=133434 RepID=A0A8B7ZD46_ACAPL|nr:proton-coupled folate transporter-like [Acanthaster planci]